VASRHPGSLHGDPEQTVMFRYDQVVGALICAVLDQYIALRLRKKTNRKSLSSHIYVVRFHFGKSLRL
jgi:hypothetical protein